MSNSFFEHRHFKKIAEIIATIGPPVIYDESERAELAKHFALKLRDTNSNFSAERFLAATAGKSINRRDRP
jgi:hypothetical protein